MKNASKKRLFNIIMVVVIAAIVFSGVMAVGSLRGWYPGNSTITVSDKLGNANIERNSIAYSLAEGTALASGDIVETLDGSTVTLNIAPAGSLVLGESTQIIIQSTKGNEISVEVTYGEVFANVDAQKATTLALNVGDRVISAGRAVFSLSAPSGSQSVYVYSGSVSFTANDLFGETSAQAGQAASLLTGTSGGTVCTLGALSAASLNDFLIGQVRSANDTVSLCFADDELDAVLTARQNEMLASETEREAHKQELLAQGGNVQVPVESGDTAENTPPIESSGSGSSGNSSSGSGTSGSNVPESAKPSPTATAAPTKAPEIYTCTISIRCDTILDNMEKLVEGKEKYVSSNGVILATSSVQFYDGETVFDVLKRTCKAAGIQLEYSWTPMYNSYYIEGINHLYEFDCGEESGWMYKVNGWFPNYGCSAYTLKDGDVIVWCYTCNGLGADVGGSVY